MSLEQIVKYSGGVLLLLLTFIQITPIKINPWSWLAKQIGKALHQDILIELRDVQKLHQKDTTEMEKRVSLLEDQQTEFQEYCKKGDAKTARRRILRCSDELRMGIKHSQEFFHDVLDDISFYNNYCKEHPKFKNMQAVEAIKFITETYQHCLKENKFL